MPRDRRAAQALQNAELDFVRREFIKPVKAIGKALQRLARQAKNQIGMHMRLAFAHQPAQVVSGLGVVLFARNALLHFGVEALNTDFKLQRAGRKLHDQRFEPVRQAVGNDFKMHEQIGHHPIQEKLQNPHRKIDLQIESAVNKLEVARAALKQRVHLGHEAVQLKRPRRLVKRTQAKLALERAAARGFDIQQALGQVFCRVFVVGQGQCLQRRLLADNDFHERLRAIEQRAAQLGESHIAPAGDDVVG